jgi:type I restriction enzyme R subunit
MKFTEARLEEIFAELLAQEGYPHTLGNALTRSPEEVLIKEDLRNYLLTRYKKEGLTTSEADAIILKLDTLPSSDLYESNKKIIYWLSEGFTLKREDRQQKDIHIELIDYTGLDTQRKSEQLDNVFAEATEQYGKDQNIYRFVNQLEILGSEKRIPDGIIYINGLPLVVFEFKSAIREEATLHSAYEQITTRYKRDIPELLKYNAFCIISDGVNNKAGSLFAPYEFYYAWRRVAGLAKDLPVPKLGEGEFCIYILQCSDGSFYKGQTNDLKRRIKEHNEGKVSHTSKHLPVELIRWEFFHTRKDAVKRESDLKTGYGRTWLKRNFEKKTLAKWARQTGVEGFDSMFTLVQGMLNQHRLRDIIQNFIYIPDTSKKNEKIVCRYPQYYAARRLYENIKKVAKPQGNGKGGTYFGATGCGKSFTMLFLTRLLMKSKHFESPTIVLITDRTDLDEQLSKQFTNAKKYVGDNGIESVESREDLRDKLQNRQSGGVFLTTIHKFTEDTQLLTQRSNVICISDEAHRSQINLDQKVKVSSKGVKKTYGFAKYLHDSLPNATYVGFTGTPIDATLDVFGEVIDAYTMTESVNDEITVRIVYEGRAAKIILDNSELQKIEDYYEQAAEDGANEYQVAESKKATTTMNTILGDPDRLKALAKDFVVHYDNRVNEGSTVKGKAMFVCSSREIGYEFYKNVIVLRPEWAKVKIAEEGVTLTEEEKKEIKPMERIKMIMTRSKDDVEDMYKLLGTKDYRKELDRQFKNEKSNFKIAIVVDMWLTGFDVPFLDSIYIDKPIRQHNLIQTISRVNRKFAGKNKGLVVDYIGIKKYMNLALAKYSKGDESNIEDIKASFIVFRDHLDLLAKIFHKFDSTKYFEGSPLEQLHTLNMAVEHVQKSKKIETRFMDLVKRLKAAYDICAGSEQISQEERDYTHFYLAVKPIVFKLTKGDAPDTEQMNAKVREMIKDALESDGVQELFKMGDDNESEQDIFDKDYLAKIDKIKLPNTKIKLLQQLLAKAIGEIKKVNKVKGIDFSKKMQALVEKYNERKEDDILRSEVYEDMAEHLTNLIWEVQKEFSAGDELGIDFEEKAFYDILKDLCVKYDFRYPEDKLIVLSKAVKSLVDTQAQFPDWSKREDIKSALKVGIILLLDEHGYPPVTRDEVYKDIFEQAENFKRNRG